MRGLLGLLEIRQGISTGLVGHGGSWRVDCNGFNALERAQKCMWAAANNGAVYVFDLMTHAMLRQLDVHVDRVRALCSVPDEEDVELVISGSGKCF